MKPRLRIGLVLLCLIVSLIPPVEGNGWPEEQTRHIEAPPSPYDADMFVTEAGIGFSSTLVTVLDPNMDIYAGLFFKDMKINHWFYLENATLRLHTASSMDFDADSSFTIYGINDYRFFGLGHYSSWAFGAPSTIMNAPKTSAYVNYNSSQFYGSQWWDIDVTNIVQELKSRPHYDGPGMDFNDPGDNMGFVILGAGGHDTRYFYDLSAGTGFEAQLHLHWDYSPSPPGDYPTAVFNETYGNHTIWFVGGTVGYPLEPIEYAWTKIDAADNYVKFDNLTASGPFQVAYVGGGLYPGTQGRGRRLVRTSNGTLWIAYVNRTGTTNQFFAEKSLDNGTTWIGETQIGSDWEHASLAGFASIAVDGNDNLHAVYHPYDGGLSSVNYSKFNGTWSSPITISDGLGREGQGQNSGFIAVDPENHIHVMWTGKATGYAFQQIWHRERTTSWGSTTRASINPDVVNKHMGNPSFTIDSNGVIHAVWQGDTLSAHSQIWYSNYTDAWSNPEIRGTYAGMDHEEQAEASIAVDSNDVVHIVWDGGATGHPGTTQIWYSNNSDGWSYPLRISTYGDMATSAQNEPSIAVNSTGGLHVMWHGTASGYGTDTLWHTDRGDAGWATPDPIQNEAPPLLQRYASLRWARWPIPSDDIYIVVDANGTVVSDDCLTLECAENWIDIEDTDPEDPDPGGQWSEGPGGATGPFTRFRIRLYLLILGFGCVFGPVLFFSWRRPTGYYLLAGALVIMAGLGLLMAIGDI